MTRIHKFLKSLSKEEWNYLRMSLNYAESIWDLQKQFCLSNKELIKRLSWSKYKLKNMQIGAFSCTIKDLAKLECLIKEEIQNSQTVTINLKKKTRI